MKRKALTLLVAVLLSITLAQEVKPMIVAVQDEVTQETLAIFNAYVQDHSASGYAANAVFHDMTLPEPFVGREAIADMLTAIYEVGFPGAEAEVKRITAAGNIVVLEFTFHGTNTGEFAGNAPTGKTISVPMIAVYNIRDGAIQEAWLYYDAAGYARQIGWVP